MKSRILLVALLCLSAVSCGKKAGMTSQAGVANNNINTNIDPVTGLPVNTTPGAPVVNIPPGSGPYIPPTTGPAQNPGLGWWEDIDTFYYGGTAPFIFDGKSIYEQYTKRTITDLSQLSNVRINLNLERYCDSSGNSYGGTVTIRYGYNGQLWQGFFTSGHSADNTRYNIWFNKDNKNVWHGFFEDFMGGIVVVLDGTASLTDGLQPGDKVSGSVWFKNFANTATDVHPPAYCWFVTSGPYDCRAWRREAPYYDVETTRAIAPDYGYQRLGTFTNMVIGDAFNGDIVL